jgi:GntR family transcriptional regulator
MTAIFRFRLNSNSALSPYRQLVQQVIAAIAEGRLVPGDQLPAVREVVTQVTINPNTVQRAYREMEHLGITVARAGLGTFVSEIAPSLSNADVVQLRDELRWWAQRAQTAGLTRETVNDLINQVLGDEMRLGHN